VPYRWSEHWEFLFSELLKEEPKPKKKGRPKGKRTKHRQVGGEQRGW